MMNFMIKTQENFNTILLEAVKQRIQCNKKRVEQLYQVFMKQAANLQAQSMPACELEGNFLKILKILRTYSVGVDSVNPPVIEIFLEQMKFHEQTELKKMLQSDPELNLEIGLIRERIHQIEFEIMNKTYKPPTTPS